MRGSVSSRIALVTVLGGCVLACCSVAVSQPTPATQTSVPKKRSATKKPASLSVAPPPQAVPVNPVPAAPPQPQSLLQEPARRAQIRLNAQGLLIQADNSNLSQILRDIASTSGMKLDGLGRDERIFGSYGPGAAKDVLGKLLEGTGYNVLMIGETEQGAPRQLVLTPRNGASPTMPMASAAPARKADEDDDAADPGDDAQQPPAQPDAAPQQQPPSGEQTPGGVKTPQQLLEELRQMREQNQAPQQNTQPQSPQ